MMQFDQSLFNQAVAQPSLLGNQSNRGVMYHQPPTPQPPKELWPGFGVEYTTGKNGKPPRSREALASLHPYMKDKLERIRDLAFDKHGLKMIFTSGHRNEAQQKDKFDSGASKAKFGGSSHSYGQGVDFYFQGGDEAMFRKRRRMKNKDGKWTGQPFAYDKDGPGELTKGTDPTDFRLVADLAAAEGLEWGGTAGVGTAGDYGHLGPAGFSKYGKLAQQQMQAPGMDKQLYAQTMSDQMIADDQERMGLIPSASEPEPPLSLGGLTGWMTTEGRPAYHNNFGGMSTEYSIGTTNSKINNGLLTHIPSIYDGKIVDQRTAEDMIINNKGYDPETGRFVTPGGNPEERSKGLELVKNTARKKFAPGKYSEQNLGMPQSKRTANKPFPPGTYK